MAPIAKRRKLDQVDEITFDPDARQEYLTGFHKRKQQRIENAREAAIRREKEERVKERRQIRERRREELENHVAQVNAELRKQNPEPSDSEAAAEVNGDDAGWDDAEDRVPEVAQEEDFVDEDKYTTVTVEAMGEPGDESEDEAAMRDASHVAKASGHLDAAKKRVKSRESKPKAKKKQKFRYENKAERSATRHKQKTKNRAAMLRRKGKD